MDAIDIIGFIIGLFSIISSLMIIVLYYREVKTNQITFYVIILSVIDILIVISSSPYISIYSYSNTECYIMSVLHTFTLIASGLVNFCIIELIYKGLQKELTMSIVQSDRENLLFFMLFYGIIGSIGPIWTDSFLIQPEGCYVPYEADTFAFVWVWFDILVPLGIVFIYLIVAFCRNVWVKKDVSIFILPGIFFLCNIGIYIDGILQLFGIVSDDLENTHIITRNAQGLLFSIFYARNAFKIKPFNTLRESFIIGNDKDDTKSDIMLL